MRKLRSTVAVGAATAAVGSMLLCASPALAKHAAKKTDAKLAVVDDEPMSQHATRPPTQSDEIKIEALSTRGTDAPAPKTIVRDTPTPTAVGVQTGLPDALTHQPTPPPPASEGAPAVFDNEAMVELAAKQMRHERKSLDACAAAAQERHPSATGTVTLHFTVADRRVVEVAVDKDSLHDGALTSCLVAAGKTLSFSLKQVSFYWPVSLSPSASN
jgi:hypothetical protein